MVNTVFLFYYISGIIQIHLHIVHREYIYVLQNVEYDQKKNVLFFELFGLSVSHCPLCFGNKKIL